MRARGRGMTWWARTAQKSGSRRAGLIVVSVKDVSHGFGKKFGSSPVWNSEEQQRQRRCGTKL